MALQDARTFLESIGAYTQNGAKPSVEALGVRLATLDPAYPGTGLAKVKFDGEDKVTAKGYMWSSTYTPVKGDRIYMLAAGSSYIIGGAVTSSITAPPEAPVSNKGYMDLNILSSALNITTTEVLAASLASVPVVQNRYYRLTYATNLYSTAPDHAMAVNFKQQAVGGTGIGGTFLGGGTVWTHPTRQNVGIHAVVVSDFRATATGNIRLVCTLNRAIGSATIVLGGSDVTNTRSFAMEDLGI